MRVTLVQQRQLVQAVDLALVLHFLFALLQKLQQVLQLEVAACQADGGQQSDALPRVKDSLHLLYDERLFDLICTHEQVGCHAGGGARESPEHN